MISNVSTLESFLNASTLHTRPQKSKNSPTMVGFMDLALEIRQQIYAYVIEDEFNQLRAHVGLNHVHFPIMPLCLMSPPHIANEARPILYRIAVIRNDINILGSMSEQLLSEIRNLDFIYSEKHYIDGSNGKPKWTLQNFRPELLQSQVFHLENLRTVTVKFHLDLATWWKKDTGAGFAGSYNEKLRGHLELLVEYAKLYRPCAATDENEGTNLTLRVIFEVYTGPREVATLRGGFKWSHDNSEAVIEGIKSIVVKHRGDI